MRIGGIPLAVRVARALRYVAYPVLTVGSAAGTGLPSVSDPRMGPLAAFVAGAVALAGDPPVHVQPIILVACDMPFVDVSLLGRLVDLIEDYDAVIPVLEGHDQPLCAAYSPKAVDAARQLVGDGTLAMRDLTSTLNVRRFAADEWAHSLIDVDTPEEFESARRTFEDPQ